MATEIVQRGLVGRLLRYAQKQSDGQASTPAGLRTWAYGEQMVINPIPHKAALAEEGAFYTTGLPAATTTVYGVTTAYTTFATSNPLLVIQNNDVTQGINVVPDSIRFSLTAANTSATSVNYAIVLDQSRAPTANATQLNGVAQAGPYNANPNVGSQSVINAWYTTSGANMTVPSATSAARYIVRNGYLKNAINSAFDEFIITFGAVDGLAGGQNGTAAGHYVAAAPPIVIPPQWFMLLYVWFPSGTLFPTVNALEFNHYER